jgi:hypothetical protein
MVSPVRAWSAAVLSLAGLLPAQWGDKADVDPEKQARRLVSFMELPDRRRDAVAELLQLGPVAVPALCGKFRDPRPEVVFRCLTALRALGPAAKAALPHLDQLQKSDDAALRHGAAWCAHGIRSTGVTLILQKGAAKVLLVDAAGKTLRETGKLEAIYDAELLADGRILICRTTGEVQELDANDKVVWEYKAGVAIDVDRLANGNTLISCGRDKRVIEVDRAGKIVWQWK